MKVLWLRPSTGENVSVRRQRIAEKLSDRGVEADLCDASGTDLPKAVFRAITGDYDVILGNVRIGLYAGFPLATVLRTPFIGDVSDPISDIGSLPRPLFNALERYEWAALRHADAAVFVHDVSYQEAQERGIEGEKLPNAVDFDKFADPDSDSVEQARATLTSQGIDLNSPIGMYIGSFPRSYHLDELLEAAAMTPEWQFVFIGEGTMEDRIQEAARTQPNVFYPGVFSYDLVPGFLSHASVGFCLTDAEQPLKLKEYGAAGLITLVPPGILEQWYSRDELVFVDPNPEAIGRTLSEISAERHRFRQLAKNLQRTTKEYSWEAVADGYYELFEELIRTNTEAD